jgi:hypothetical protein
MYFSLNEERVVLHFSPHPYVRISGPDNLYYVELREYVDNDDKSLAIEGYKVSVVDTGWRTWFDVPIEFYGDFEISISKYIPNYGLKRIYTHRFNDYGKLVKFNLNTTDKDECLLWIDRVMEYKRIHGCNTSIHTNFDDINKKYSDYYNTDQIDYYKIYNIGRFPKQSTDFKTVDARKEGVIWYGNWKTFWSYQHPRCWNTLSSQEIIDDILGL